MMEIKKLTKQHCKEIAKIHTVSFPGFFLTSLGEHFLYAFYKAIVRNKESVNIGLFENGELIGFAIGSITNESFYKKALSQNFLELGFAAIIPLIKNPKNLKRLYNSLVSSNKKELDEINAGILLSICINPYHESKGNGKRLLNEFEKIVFKHQSATTLTTDKENNKYVNDFYLRNGYVLKTEFMQGQRKMNLYIKHK